VETAVGTPASEIVAEKNNKNIAIVPMYKTSSIDLKSFFIFLPTRIYSNSVSLFIINFCEIFAQIGLKFVHFHVIASRNISYIP